MSYLVLSEEEIDEISLRIGTKIRALRKEKKVTQVRLAAALGVTFQQVQKYEKGKNRVSVPTLIAIARCLRVHTSYFLEEFEIGAFALAA